MTSLFISAVSEEFRTWREFLRQKLIVREVQVQTQEILIPSGLPTLFTLDDYIKNCDVVIHLVGKRTGREDGSSVPGGERVREFIEQRYPQLPQRLGVLEDYLATLTFTQWEAWLAVFHRKRLFLPIPVEDLQTDNSLTEGAPRKNACRPDDPRGHPPPLPPSPPSNAPRRFRIAAHGFSDRPSSLSWW